MIEINNAQDILNNIDILKNRIICNYAGDIIVYDKKDISPDKKYIFDKNLFYKLKDLNLLEYQYCTASHRTVSNYILSNNINNLGIYKKYLELILKNSYNKKFKSLKEIIGFINNLGYICFRNECVYSRSYWGGANYAKCLTVKLDDNKFINIEYYMSENVKIKNFLFRDTLRMYCKLFTKYDYPTNERNSDKYKIWNKDRRSFKTNKKLWEKDYTELSEKILNKINNSYIEVL